MKVSYVKTNERQLEKPLEIEFNSDMQNEILMFWDKVWNAPVSNATLVTFASSEKHLMGHFTSPNWGFSRTEDAVEFYQHIVFQSMKSYSLSYSQIENFSSHDAFNLFKCNNFRMSMFWRVLILCNNEYLTDFYRYFHAYGELNRSQSQEINFVLTKISENNAS